jgi:hypothetical protein
MAARCAWVHYSQRRRAAFRVHAKVPEIAGACARSVVGLRAWAAAGIAELGKLRVGGIVTRVWQPGGR